MDGGVIRYSTKVASITQNGFILTTYSTNTITNIIVQWMAFLDDNIHSQADSIVQYITSQQVYPNVALLIPQAQIPQAAVFLTGVSQTSTTTSDNYEYQVYINSISLTSIQLLIDITTGFAISQLDYNIIYGSPQYLTAGQKQLSSLGSFQLFTIDQGTKVSSVGFSEIFGTGRIRINLSYINGLAVIQTWGPSSVYVVVLSYFNYMPCPLYCTTCYIAPIFCDGCVTSTYRTGSGCTSCQTQMFMTTGQMNCQNCQSYCNQCSGSATNCITCQTTAQRMNPPLCTTCPLQMFIQANIDDCQQCSVYCDQCTTSATYCTQCNALTFRINPPNCSQCAIMMFIQSGIQNCQQCGIYCGQCTSSANNCTICLAGTYRVNLPDCDICQTQYYSITNVIICQACTNYCNECIWSANNCQACKTGTLRLNPPDCQTCPAQYHLVYNNVNCQPCLQYCNNCQPYKSQCIACSSSSLRLNPPDCLDCPQYYYTIQNT